MNVHVIDEKAVFTTARVIAEPAERDAYLVQECRDDLQMLARIRELLRIADEGGSFLETAALAVTAPFESAAQLIGTQIGPYKLRELLAEGGMGSVYVAEQELPVRRKVALKVIKPGMDTRQVLSRFEAERQALALMEHPNIAKVLDAGSTEAGRPYFVMELVKGLPITEFCDQRKLTSRERLSLFVQVCRAIQHAHQKGIIHRDIKPSNILVTLHDDLAVPVVIDFGIAKAAGPQLTEKTLYTAFNQLIGTPLYMSPEQAEFNALDVDTRSDIYSLGVLLYELLTGSTPFESETFRRESLDEIRRMIREVDPPRPSQRVSTLSAENSSTVNANRRVEGRQLRHVLRGDLDWIVMKALEKDRNRRYESASSLAADVERHLDGEPIEARPPGYFAGARKWCRRHQSVVLSSAAVLIIFSVVSMVCAALLFGERQRTAAAAAESKAIVNFLVNELLVAPGTQLKEGRELTVAEVFSNAEAKIGPALADQPMVEAAIRHVMGKVYRRLGKDDLAESQLRRAFTLRSKTDPTDGETFRIRDDLADVLNNLNRPDEAREVIEEGLEIARQSLGDAHPDTLRAMGLFLSQSLAAYNFRTQGHRAALLAENAEGYVNEDPDKELAKAQLLGEEAFELSMRLHGLEHPATLNIMLHLSAIDAIRGEHDKALKLCQDGMETSRRLYGLNHNATLLFQNRLYEILGASGRYEEASALGEEHLTTIRKFNGVKHRITLSFMINQATTYLELGNADKARHLCEEGLEASREAFGADHAMTRELMQKLVAVLCIEEKYDRAANTQEEIIESLRRSYGPEHKATLSATHFLTGILRKQGKIDEARQLVDELVNLTPNNWHALDLLAWSMATSQKEFRDGEKAVEIAKKACELSKYQEASPVDTLAAAYAEAGDFDEAVKWSEKALEMAQDEPIRAARYTKHLERIQSHKPWREPLE